MIGAMIPDADVQVEVSYREAVVDEPLSALVGSPFYADFEILATVVPEMTAEKLRALSQRVRASDLADLARDARPRGHARRGQRSSREGEVRTREVGRCESRRALQVCWN